MFTAYDPADRDVRDSLRLLFVLGLVEFAPFGFAYKLKEP